LKPVVAIYSTFLQRAYDQLIHDISVQELDVTLAIDRAGIVGADGPTHQGAFDLSFLRCVPGLTILAPADEAECRDMLYTAYLHPGPAAVRYPRGSGPGVAEKTAMTQLPIGQAHVRRQGHCIALLTFGTMLEPALQAAAELDATVVNMRSVKPLDQDTILAMADRHDLIVTLEENAVRGGAGAGVAEVLSDHGQAIPLLILGLPDQHIGQGEPAEVLARCGLDAAGIIKSIRNGLPPELARTLESA
jgi:1-deoxy-D-xylulose-5-phosphate synthase